MIGARTLVLAGALLNLAACASEPDIPPWQKPGASQESTRIAWSSCRRLANNEVRDIMAHDVNALTDNPVGGSAGADASLEDLQRERLAAKERQLRSDAIDRCMIASGFAHRTK